MKKKKIVIILVIVAIVIFGCLKGCNITLYGVYVSNSQYYLTPKEAIYADMTGSAIELKTDIGVVNITDNGAIYLGLTNENELFLAELKTKDDEYYFVGNYQKYASGEFEDDFTNNKLNFTKTFLYDESGKKSNDLQYAVIYDDVEAIDIPSEAEIICFDDAKDDRNLYFIYVLS